MSQQIRTVQDIVLRAFYLTRVYSPKNPPNEAQLNEGIQLLNLMFDDMAKNNVFIPVNTFYEFELTGGKASYTFSDTVPADFNQAMIVDLQSCVMNYQNVLQPIQILTPEQIAGLYLIQNTRQQPGYVVLEKLQEYSKLTFYQTPDQNYSIQIRYKAIISSVELNDDLDNVPNYCHLYLIYALGSVIGDFYSNAIWDEKKQAKLEKMESQIAASNPSVTTNPMPIELQPLTGLFGVYPWYWQNGGL